MKSAKLLLSAFTVFLSLNVSAQWESITNLDNTTQNYNGINVAVTAGGSAQTGGGCIGLYWIQQSDDFYTFDFSAPVAGIKLELDALNNGESVEFYVNGVMFPVLNCNMDTAQFVGNCSYGNCNIVNGQLVNTNIGTWWVCGGVLTFYGPITSFKIKEPVGGSGATFNIWFAATGSSIGGCLTQTSGQGMFTLSANKTCAGLSVANITSTYTSGMSIVSWYGDGSADTTAVLQGNGTGYAYSGHDYAASGNYTVKQVLYISNVAVDSLSSNHDHLFCTDIPVQLYHDLNSNCVFDNNELQPFFSSLVEVDSNNIHIDTISATSGFFYKAYGNPGDVYSFRLISLPGDVVATCPTTGEINLTLQNLVYYTSPNYIGLGCVTSNNYDLDISVTSLVTAANLSVGNVVAANTHCMPVNGVLTLSFSPKYTYGTSSITPSSQSGNSVSWNLSALSGITNPAEIVTFILYANGNYLTIGDTVHTNISITPTSGDVNIANNMIVSEDTVTGPYDPNAIYVEPGTCVTPGTRLKYTVTFENLGNAPAQNIHVMDTLSAGLDFNSVKIIGASHTMLVSKLTNGGYNVLKFEFPGINLPGSTSPDRHGFVMYTAEMTDNFPIGSSVSNKAGIYFDYMPPVLTNVASTEACWPVSINSIQVNQQGISVYPNPATDELTIKTEEQYHSYTISNSLGQRMQNAVLSSKETRVNIKSLPPGLYYLNLAGDRGTEVRKFVKM